MLIDAHNHLQEEVLVPYVDGVVQRARRAGVGEMWCNGTAEDDWQAVLDLARAHPGIVPFFGLHPWFVKERSPDWLAELERFLDSAPSGVGEIGLDRMVTGADEPAQEEVFRAQVELARRRGLPVTIHCLKAWGWMLEVLRDLGPSLPPMLIHAYSGAAELIQPLTRLGAYFSFAGSVLDERHLRARAALQTVPLDRLLLETDAPALLPPEPHRQYVLVIDDQTYNEPANLPAIVEGVAGLLEMPACRLADLTAENAARFRKGAGGAEL